MESPCMRLVAAKGSCREWEKAVLRQGSRFLHPAMFFQASCNPKFFVIVVYAKKGSMEHHKGCHMCRWDNALALGAALTRCPP
jgi:hypothetical protein